MNEIRITGVSESIKEDLSTIAKDMGVTLSGYLKPKLREIADDYYTKNPQRKRD